MDFVGKGGIYCILFILLKYVARGQRNEEEKFMPI